MMGGMEKTTVYLTSEQKGALARAAADEGRSEAHLIRAGIDAAIERHRLGETPVSVELARASSLPAPLAERPRWVGRETFLGLIAGRQADPGLADELRVLAPGTTDDEPIP